MYDFRADHLVLDHQLGAILWGDDPAFGIPWLFVVLRLVLWALREFSPPSVLASLWVSSLTQSLGSRAHTGAQAPRDRLCLAKFS